MMKLVPEVLEILQKYILVDSNYYIKIPLKNDSKIPKCN